MPIVVTTPTGNIGRHVIHQLMATGRSLRVIVRDPNKLTADVRARAEVIQGSIADPALLIRSLDGAEALFWCIPQSNTQENVLEYYLQFSRAIATAIAQTQPLRVVAVSSGGYGRAAKAGPISALHAMEAVLNQTGVAIKYLRCGNFMENFLWQLQPIAKQGVFFYPFPPDFPIPLVAAQDIAAAAVRWLIQPDWAGQSGVGVHGAADLSFNQAAEILSTALDRPVRFQPIPPEMFYQSMLKEGSSPAFAQALIEMFAAVAAGIYQAEPRTPETTTPTSLQQWTKTMLLPIIEHHQS